MKEIIKELEEIGSALLTTNSIRGRQILDISKRLSLSSPIEPPPDLEKAIEQGITDARALRGEAAPVLNAAHILKVNILSRVRQALERTQASSEIREALVKLRDEAQAEQENIFLPPHRRDIAFHEKRTYNKVLELLAPSRQGATT